MFWYLIVNFFALFLVSWIVIKLSKRNFEFQVKQLCFNMPISISNDSVIEYLKAISQEKKVFFAVGLEAIKIVEQIEKIDSKQIYHYIENTNNIQIINFDKPPKNVSIITSDTINKEEESLLSPLIAKLHQNNKKIFVYIVVFYLIDKQDKNKIQNIADLLKKDTDLITTIQNKNDLLYHIKNTRILLANWCEMPFFIYLDIMIFAEIL